MYHRNKQIEIMGTFKVLHRKTTYTNPVTGKKAIVVKTQKEGTKRTFFSVQNVDEKFITNTMYAREYDANAVAKRYCNA